MPSLRIEDLPEADVLDGTELIDIVQNGNSRRLALALLLLAQTTAAALAFVPAPGLAAINLETALRLGLPEMPEHYGAVGDGLADDTAEVQLVLNSGAKEIYLSKTYAVTGCYLYNTANVKISGPGTLQMTGAPVNGTHALAFIQCRNIILEGLTIHGNSETRGGAAGANNLSFYGCSNVSVRNVQSLYSAGDGVYVNRASGSVVINGIAMSAGTVISSNIMFDTCLFDYAYRNGATVVACEGYSFPNCIFSNTGKSTAGTAAPSAGVDLEPNDTVQYFPKRGSFTNCRWVNNTGAHLIVNGRCVETTVDSGHMEGGTSYGVSISGSRTTIRNTLIKDTGAVGGSPRGSILIQSQAGSRASAIIENCEITGAIFGGVTVNSYADVHIRQLKVSDGANFGVRYTAGADPGDGNKGFCDVDGLRIERLFSSSPPANAAYIMGGSYDGRLHLRKARLLRTGATGAPIEIGINLGTATPTDVQEISDLNAVGAFATTTAAGLSVAKILRNNRLDDVVTPALNMAGSAAYDPPSIAAGSSATTTIAVTGAALGEKYAPSFSLSLGGLVLTAYVSAANTVTCVFSNPTAAPIDLANGTLTVSRLWV